MNIIEKFQDELIEFSDQFDSLAGRYDCTDDHCSELEILIGDYSEFILNKQNKEIWEQIEQEASIDLHQLVEDLRKKSARCVAIMEKYRALKLQNDNAEIAGYFKNIESCIEREFGSFQVTATSKVLLVGSGAFPMTPLFIAKRTGAAVVGVDIDDEAIKLGVGVVEKLGRELNIRLENVLVENLDCIKDVTHVIFSSTVASKYDILEQLHALTNEHVIVVMRYGDQLKSLFNYPLKEVAEQKWKLVENILRPYHVFDIAIYQKA